MTKENKHRVHLDQQNHITLFPSKQRCPECGSAKLRQYHIQDYSGKSTRYTECDKCGEIIDDLAKQSLEEAAIEYEKEYEAYHGIDSTHIRVVFKAGAKWAKKNNY